MIYTLRDYQKEASSIGLNYFKTNSNKNGLMILPCGAGKSLIIADIAKALNDNVLILQPSKEILEQNYNKYISYGEEAGIYSASFNRKEITKVTYATIGSIINKKDDFSLFNYIIVDEADRVNPKGGQYKEFLEYINGKVIGLTATPFRLNTDGYGGSMLKFLTRTRPRMFHEVIYSVQISDLLKENYLSIMKYKTDKVFNRQDLKVNTTGADFEKISLKEYCKKIKQNQRTIDSIKIYSYRKGIICFVNSIDDAKYIQAEFSTNSRVVHSKTSKTDREKILNDFKTGEIKIIINVEILTYGFNYPELDTIIIARPTLSLSLHMQFLGRGMRPHPDKEYCLVVDLTDNVKRFGKIEDIVYVNNGNKPYIKNSKIQLTNVYFGDERNFQKGKLENSSTIMPFGKHKGKFIHRIPRYYLEWLYDKANIKGELKLAIENTLGIVTEEEPF